MIDKHRFDFHIHVETEQMTPYTALDLIRKMGLKAGMVDHVFSDRNRITSGEIKKDCREKYPQVDFLHGCETDVYGDGLIALPEELVPDMDFIIVSFTHLGQPGVVRDKDVEDLEKLAARLLYLFEAAVNWPHTDIIGHPLALPIAPEQAAAVPQHIDVQKLDSLLRVAAARNILIEINSRTLRRMSTVPQRFFIERAIQNGCLFSIGSDAHCLEETGLTTEAWELIEQLNVPLDRITCPVK